MVDACRERTPATVTTTEDPTQPSKAVIANIDGLKDEVQKKRKDAGQTLDPLMMKVYAHDAATGAWVDVPKASASLTSNTEETAYHVVVDF